MARWTHPLVLLIVTLLAIAPAQADPQLPSPPLGTLDVRGPAYVADCDGWMRGHKGRSQPGGAPVECRGLTVGDIVGLGPLATGTDAGALTGILAVDRLAAGSIAASKLEMGAAAANLGAAIGTSGAAIPLLSTANTWSGKQSMSQLALGPGPFSFDGTAQAQFTQTQSVYAANGSLGALYGQRIASYSGGAASDSVSPVMGAVRGYNQIQSQAGRAVEGAGLFVTDNYSGLTQGVGVHGQCLSRDSGRCWGAVLEVHELPRVFTATVGQTVFAIPNGYVAGNAVVTKNGALLTRTTDYSDASGTQIVLASGATAGDVIRVYLGNPQQGAIGAELDVFASPGADTTNAMSGNRIILGLYGYNRDRLAVDTHIGSGLNIIADPTDPNLTIDRGVGFQGRFKNAIDTTASNVSITGNAIALGATHNIGIGATSTTFPIEIAGNSTSRPNGVQTRWRDSTASPSIDVRAGAVGVFGIGAAGVYSAHDFGLYAQGVMALRLQSGRAKLQSGVVMSWTPGTLPSAPVEGDCTWNALVHKLGCYDGTVWQYLW